MDHLTITSDPRLPGAARTCTAEPLIVNSWMKGVSSLSGDVYESQEKRKTGDSHVKHGMDQTPRLCIIAISFPATQQVNILWHVVTRPSHRYLSATRISTRMAVLPVTANNPIALRVRACTPLWNVGKLQGTQATDADLEHVLRSHSCVLIG